MDSKLDLDSKVKVVANDTILTIPISGAFFSKLQQTLYHLLAQKPPADVTRIIKELETRDAADFWEHEVTIYLALIYQLEEAAKKGNHIIEKPVTDFLPKEDPSEEASPES
jgi:hypothetical protein